MILNGQTFSVPGVFGVTEIVNESGTSTPSFNVGVIVGKQSRGVPYTQGLQNGNNPPPMTADEFILGFSGSAKTIANGGEDGDNDVLTMFRYAKSVGAGTVFELNVNPLTQLTGVQINNNAGTPVLSLTAASVGFGAEFNDIQLTIASSVHTIVPPMKVTYLTANALTTDTTVSVNNASKYTAGQTVYATDNSQTAPIQLTVQSVDTVNNKVTFTAAIGKALATAAYARLFMLNTAAQVTSTALTDSVSLAAFYSSTGNGILTATVVAGITPPTTLAATFLGYMSGATQATSPAATATDWQNIADNFARWNEEFAAVNGVYLRYVLVGSSDAQNHAAFSSLATTMYQNNNPIANISGCELGDIFLTTSDADYPIMRAKALNSDKFILCESGLDGYAAWKSTAAEVLGIKNANAPNHNLTLDPVVATKVEKSYIQIDPDYETHTRNGLITIVQSKVGYRFGMAVTTYQDQSTTFNEDTKMTYLQVNRDIADFVLRMDMDNIDRFAGADGVTSEQLFSVASNTGNVLVNQLQYVSSYTINSIVKQGNAWIIDRRVGLESPTDQIGIINEIFVQD